MWIARVWFLFALLAASFLIAGGLTLPNVRDADLTSRTAELAAAEAEIVNAKVAAQMADQRRATQLLAADPRLQATLEQLTEEMPVDVRRALLVKILKLIGADHPRLSLALIGPEGLRAETGVPNAPAIPQSEPVARALEGRVGVGLVTDGQPRWIVATPLVGSKTPAAFLTSTVPPGTTIARTHEESQLHTAIVVQRGDTVIEGSLPAADLPVVGAGAPPIGPAGVGNTKPLTLSAGPYFVRRFAVPSAPGFTFVLAWPVEPATGLDQVGGITGLPARALSHTQGLGVALAVALLVWLLGMLLMSSGARGAVRRLARDLRLLGADRHSLLDPGAYSGWLRPIIDSANEAAEDARKANARTIALEIPSADLAAEPARPRPPEVPAERSGDQALASAAATAASDERSGEPAAEASADDSVDEPGDSIDTSLGSLDDAPGPRSGRPSAAPPEAEAEDPEDEPEESETSGDPTQRRIRTPGQPAVPIQRTPLRPEIPAEISSSLFDMSLPSLEADEDEPEEEEPTDAGIELPRSAERPASRQGSLLDRLRAQSALDPGKGAPPFSSGDSTVVKPVPIELLSRSREDEDRTAVGPPPTRPADRDAQEAYYQQVFEEFLATKARCGERTDNVEFTRFRAKLVRTRSALMERFECRDVKFRVYVKAGAAALKASPVVDD